jgi:hypothetical protein
MCPEWRLTPAAASLFIFIFIFAQFKTHGCALSSVNASICNDLTSQMDDLTEVFAERERERERESKHTHTHTPPYKVNVLGH